MNKTPRNRPTTIDGIIERLGEIVGWSSSGASRLGYFAALYRRVTITVRDLLGKNYFDDDQRMERLDVTFANRYLDALDDYASGGPACTEPWRVAFDEVANRKLIILQHLMLGMNAHIELDLGIAVAEIAPAGALPSIHDDFNKINTLLAALSPIVEAEIGALSPMIRLAESIGKAFEKPIVDTGMLIARRTAWSLAKELAPLSSSAQKPLIAQRAREVAVSGRDIANPPLLARAALKVVSIPESRDVRAIIEVLNKNESIRFDGSPIAT